MAATTTSIDGSSLRTLETMNPGYEKPFSLESLRVTDIVAR